MNSPVSTGAELVQLSVSFSASSNVLHPYGVLNAKRRVTATARVTADNLLFVRCLLTSRISWRSSLVLLFRRFGDGPIFFVRTGNKRSESQVFASCSP